MTVGIYSTNYFKFEPYHPQASPITILTDDTNPIPLDDERLADVRWWSHTDDDYYGRVSAAWWGFHPHLALPDAEVTVSIGLNFTIKVPDLGQRCLDELGDDDMLLLKHPWRNDIVEEGAESRYNWRWNNQRIAEQVVSYIEAGHPRNWGLFHCGMVVRRDTPAMRAFNEAWWAEYCNWTSQNQISLPPLLRTSDIKWHTWSDIGQWHAEPFEKGWVRWGDLGRDTVTA